MARRPFFGQNDTKIAKMDMQAATAPGRAYAAAFQKLGDIASDTLEKFREKKEEKEREDNFERMAKKLPSEVFSAFDIQSEEEKSDFIKSIKKKGPREDAMAVMSFYQKAQDAQTARDVRDLQMDQLRRNIERQKDADLLAKEERMSENQFMQSLMSQTASPQAQSQADIARPGLAALGNGDARNRFMQAQLQQPQNQVPVSSLGSQDFGRFASREGLDPKLSVARMEALRQAELASQPKAEDMQKLFDNLQKNENELRKEFNSLPEVKDFNKVRTSYDKVVLAGSNPSPAGDISMIFNYMKILDPGSVVREGEFATAQNAGGVDDMVRNQYNRLINGERLNEGQRNDFMNQARFAAEAQFKPVAEQMGRYQAIAKNNNLRIGQVLPDSFLTMGDQLSQKFTTQADEPSKDTMGDSANSNRLASTPAGSPSSKPTQNPKFDSQIQQVLQKSSSGAELTDEEQKIIDLINKRELQSKR